MSTKKLYKVIVLHGAPKSSHKSIETFLVAENEVEVAEWIQREKCYDMWLDPEEGDEPRMVSDYEDDSEMTFRDWVMKNRGDLTDEDGWEDAYYGVTKWGWEEVENATLEFMEEMVRFGLATLTTPASDE